MDKFENASVPDKSRVKNMESCTSIEGALSLKKEKLLVIEPYYGGSHKNMLDTLLADLSEDVYTLITMTPKKWHWRARCSSLYVSQHIPFNLMEYKVLFCSSVLSLSELVGMCPQLAELKKIVYFHENQLVYPVRKHNERDIQYGYNQITTSLAADILLFNSDFNRNSFLNNIKTLLNDLPDYKTKEVAQLIAPKCRVLYFPVNFSNIVYKPDKNNALPHIVWPHRWEFDKDPDMFFNTLKRLNSEGITNYKVSVLGESFSKIPDSIVNAKTWLGDQLLHFGYVKEKNEFYEILSSADIVVSTANQEFFGVSVIESVKSGCFPLVPAKLVYPEFYPKECLYDTHAGLYRKLKELLTNPELIPVMYKNAAIDTDRFDSKNLLPAFMELFEFGDEHKKSFKI